MSGVLVLQLYAAANAGEAAGEVRALLNYPQSQALAWQQCKVAVIGSRESWLRSAQCRLPVIQGHLK